MCYAKVYLHIIREIQTDHFKINSILINISINSKYICGKSSRLRAWGKTRYWEVFSVL